MIYLTFDTNIWLNTFDESWSFDDHMDYLEYWIAQGQVKLLLPELVIKEFKNNKSKQVEQRKEDLRKFFEMAKEVFPAAFFQEYASPIKQANLINSQIDRIQKLLDSAQKIPMSEDLFQEIFDWGVSKKAPAHESKNSFADTLIIYSLFNFAKENPGNIYYFLSKDSGFYSKTEKSTIHDDLNDHFKACNIRSIKYLNHLVKSLETGFDLARNAEIDQFKKDRIQQRISSRAFNPVYESLTANQETSFIQNKQTIEFILKLKSPSKEQVIFILALIDSDDAYQQYFYKLLKDVSWIKILEKKGIFDPCNIPQTGPWHPLTYLRAISFEIEEKSPESLPLLIKVIKRITESSHKNSNLYWNFIEIISHLSSENINDEIIDLVPKWLNDSNNALISSTIFQQLLPKFYQSQPTPDIIAKGERILTHLFEMVLEENDEESKLYGVKSIDYRSKVELHYLSRIFTDQNLMIRIVTYSGDFLINLLTQKLKTLHTHFPNGIRLEVKNREDKTRCHLQVNEDVLLLRLLDFNSDSIEIPFTIIETKNKALREIKSSLQNLGIETSYDQDIDYNIDAVTDVIFQGRMYPYFPDELTDETTIYFDESKLDQVFSFLFLKTLGKLLSLFPEKGNQYVKTLALHPNYWPHYFRRAALFLISKNWNTCKRIFFEMIKYKDERGVFVTSSFYKELYKLLETNSKKITTHKLGIISEIIESSSKSLPTHEKSDGWKLRWYSALREVSPYNLKYKQLSKELNRKSEYFKNEGKLRITSGTISPWTIEDFLLKPNKEIAEFFQTFDLMHSPGEPNVDGLARAFEEAVSKNPEKFINDIDFFNQMPYIYAVHLTYGLKSAAEQKLISSWDKLFSFFLGYISSQAFKLGNLNNDASYWNPNAGMVVGHISRFFREVLRNREFEEVIDRLPVTDELIVQLSNWVESYEIPKVGINDLASYSLNSTSGRILDAVLDYSLLKFRRTTANQKAFFWPENLKQIFEMAVAAKNPDVYIIIGMNYHRFMILDKDWTIEKIRTFNSLPETEWILFMNGFVFAPLYISTIDYSIIHPHYQIVVSNPDFIHGFSRPNLRHHLAGMLFHDLDNDSSDRIVENYLLSANPIQALEFVHYLYNQLSYFQSLDELERNLVKPRVKFIWKSLSEKYAENVSEEAGKLLAILHKLMVFNEVIDEEMRNLCLQNIMHINTYRGHHSLIEVLHEVYLNGDSHEVCKNLIRILDGLELNQYRFDAVDEQIANLIVFAYENGDLEAANKLCNKLVRIGYEFLTKVYNRFINA